MAEATDVAIDILGIPEGEVLGLLELRRSLEAHLESLGATVTGAGMGFGGADFSADYGDGSYEVTLMPCPRPVEMEAPDTDHQRNLAQMLKRTLRQYGAEPFEVAEIEGAQGYRLHTFAVTIKNWETDEARPYTLLLMPASKPQGVASAGEG